LTQGSSSYDYNNSYSDSNTTSKPSYSSDSVYKRNFTGTQAVFTYSPILEKPDMVNSIGQAENDTVTILEKYNEKYYKVSSGNVVGYL
jgi:hypothetical protein